MTPEARRIQFTNGLDRFYGKKVDKTIYNFFTMMQTCVYNANPPEKKSLREL